MINRRDFIQLSAISSLGLVVGVPNFLMQDTLSRVMPGREISFSAAVKR